MIHCTEVVPPVTTLIVAGRTRSVQCTFDSMLMVIGQQAAWYTRCPLRLTEKMEKRLEYPFDAAPQGLRRRPAPFGLNAAKYEKHWIDNRIPQE
jgi:hypothetical protein